MTKYIFTHMKIKTWNNHRFLLDIDLKTSSTDVKSVDAAVEMHPTPKVNRMQMFSAEYRVNCVGDILNGRMTMCIV